MVNVSLLISPNECPVYDTKQSDGEASVIQELWWMWNTPSSPSLTCPQSDSTC